jgi:hypothetical protein
VAQIVVPRVLMSVQHWQVQPVTVGFLVEIASPLRLAQRLLPMATMQQRPA